MKRTSTAIATLTAFFALQAQSLQAQDQAVERNAAGAEWTKTLKDRTKRGTLHDQMQYIRGDTGKWSDNPTLQHAPPLAKKPAKLPLDEWADALLDQKTQTTANDDNWLLFRTKQLDDNDRVWVERIERRGNKFTVVLHQAVWQGRYRKTFTFHQLFGVNLGKLEPGSYEAHWIVQPLEFNRFEDPTSPRESWPQDERPAETKPVELRAAFTVAERAS